jgi:LmbE family N-acetylglucosaminyl deacetylase
MSKILSVVIATLLIVEGAWAQDRRPDGPRRRGLESTAQEKEARETAIAELERCDVLGIFAHPDDETFASGTFAKLSAKGKRVLLVYATSGDAGGDKTGRDLRGDALAKEREQEMRNAASALELPTQPLFLRYPDGQVYDYWEEVLANVQSIIEKTGPSVVVTFGPDGYYGHVDHLAIGQISGRAFDDSDTPSHLLHVALSRSTNDIIVQAGGGNRFKPVADKFITYNVDIKEHVSNRVAAMASHKTQFDQRTVSQLGRLSALTGKEEFVEVRHPGQAGLLSELFSN